MFGDKPLVLVLLLSLLGTATCLFEDQIGIWDWKQSYVGKIKFFHPLSLSKSQTNLIGSESNVVSSIYLRNGTVKWRMALEPKGSLQAFAIDDEQNGLHVDEYSNKELITVNSDGLFVRSWQPVTGSLSWEKRLPEELIKHRDERSTVSFLINPKKNEIVVSKLYPTNDKLILYLYVYDYLQDEIVKREKQHLNSQLADLKDCKFVSARSFVCLNVANLTVNHFAFDQMNHNEKLVNLGLKPNSQIGQLELNELGHQTSEESPVFALSFGGEQRIALLRINGKKLNLIKTFTGVDSVALKKVTLNGITKTYAFSLVSAETEKHLHQFKVAAFDMVEWNEVKSLQESFVLKYKSALLVEQFFILPFNKNQQDKYQYKLVLSTRDGSFILLSSAQGPGKINWIREESLSSVITAEIIDYPLDELDAEIESLDLVENDIYGQLLNRIKTQVSQLQAATADLIKKVNDFVNSANVRDNKDLNDNLNLDYALYAEDEQVLIRDKFGFHKMIVALTKYGKLFGIDTLKGKIIWSLNDPTLHDFLQDYLLEDESRRIPIHIQRTTSHHPFQAVGTILLPNGYVLSVDLIKGEVISRQNLNINLKQVILLSHLDSNNLKGLLLFDESNTVHFYPPSVYEEVFLNHKNKYYLVTGNAKKGVLEGYSFSNLDQTNRKADKIWSINVPVSSVQNDLKIIFKNPLEQVHSLGRVLGDRNVLYKYLNPNLIAVVNEGVETTSGQAIEYGGKKPHFISIHLVDAVTGQIIHSTMHPKCSNVHVVHTENSLVYAYFNEKFKRTEISAIDLYEGPTMANFTTFSSLNRPFYLHPAIVQHATFIFPAGITAMADTKTEKGITNKNILISMPYGGVIQMPRVFLDPRRPTNPTADHREEGLVPYVPELPIHAEAILNYNQTVINVKQILTAPATLESTSHTFVFGLDLFYTLVQPSKTFDILKEDFEYWLISSVLLLLVVFSYLSKILTTRKTLNHAWK